MRGFRFDIYLVLQSRLRNSSHLSTGPCEFGSLCMSVHIRRKQMGKDSCVLGIGNNGNKAAGVTKLCLCVWMCAGAHVLIIMFN